jgi:hypothetical protein
MSWEDIKEKRKPILIKEILDDFLKQYKQPEKTPQSIILNHWEEIISQQAVKETIPIVIKNKILIIAVSNSSLLHYLTMKKKEICANIEKFLGCNIVKDVRFKISKIKAD